MKPKTEEISKMILDYIKKNPDSEDTLEGITEWWMEANRIECSIRNITQTLEKLVNEGLITSYTANGGKILYRVRVKE